MEQENADCLLHILVKESFERMILIIFVVLTGLSLLANRKDASLYQTTCVLRLDRILQVIINNRRVGANDNMYCIIFQDSVTEDKE